ncbi:OmpA family protein [Megalodesulfovibrio gigas]|uniref:Putative major outer membrane protein n=1 Tax=Megalodesulfovibrio gigas (strain ATCC 19364 / DSM 1382 / NCIMB 9332 / VKM B-1759) TaxID=1121448 RepID=T2GA60_MEGG1|nr:OmpA family protein [Megalodesulfovibrio gigas]AGW13049.1 putative major outer membrane protein [Megalodesulfovibrio gigas DSM 1382 = ATCC 19364]
MVRLSVIKKGRACCWNRLSSLLWCALLVASSVLLYGCNQRNTPVAASVARQTPTAAMASASMTRIADADGDGIEDRLDRCPDTPSGKAVDSEGCMVPVFMKLALQYPDNENGLPPYSEERLAALATLLRENPDMRLIVDAHTDNRGTDDANQALSEERARAIKKALEARHGVPADRIVARGHGAARPLVSNASERGQARNRRAELVLSGTWKAYTGDDLPAEMMALNFAANSNVLTPQSRKSLEAIGRYLRKHPDVQARVTAKHGGAGADQQLSLARAESIQAYLSRYYGVAADQLAVEFLDAPRTAQAAPASPAPGPASPLAARYGLGSATAPGVPAVQEFGAVCFDSRQTDIQTEAAGAVEALGRMLSVSPHLRCILVGYTDNVGSDETNLRISRERAESVRQYLLTKYDINTEQLEVQGRGKDMPVASNDTEEGRRQNRRVEFRVIQIQ